ncbi:MAG: AF1514 family protein [Desulfobulbaceae bacterium]|nr:AF1514 family protein [Desulfobulbaceae bacterium]
MVHVDMAIKGVELDFDLAEKLAEDVVRNNIAEPMMLCWSDRQRGLHSPSGVQCEIKGEPGWEVYGRNHGGQYRISINSDEYVFIYC